MQAVQPPRPSALDLLDNGQLEARYAYPTDLVAPYVRTNFVASADGAATIAGRSAGLGSPADHRVFTLLRELADVLLVGAGTVRTEDYGGVRRPTRGTDRPPPIAVVTASAQLDPNSRLFTDTRVPPIILTLRSVPVEQRERLAAAGGDVVTMTRLTPNLILAELARRGLHRVLCEGGPTLHGELIAADAIDELCLTVAPLLAGGSAGRITAGSTDPPTLRMELADVLHDDGVLLLRYRRQPVAPGASR